MKDLKQKLLQLGLSFALLGLGFNSNAQSQVTPTAKNPIITQDIDPPGNGNPNPPVVLSSDEKINDLIEIEVYPNPNNGNFNVKINDKIDFENIIITDLTGNVIYKQNVKGMLDKEISIDLTNAKKGLYLLSTGKSVHKFKVL